MQAISWGRIEADQEVMTALKAVSKMCLLDSA